MFDLGDAVPLTFSSGSADTGATPVCTVTLPDASTATPSVLHTGPGAYAASYTTTQSGRHFVRWVGTGTNASAFTDVFDVHSVTGGPQLFSLDEGRKALREPTDSSLDNEELRGYIITATRVVEDVYGPVVPQTIVQTFDGGRRALQCDTSITSITSVTESGSSLVVATDFTVDYDAGILTRGTYAGSVFAEPTVSDPATFPAVWAFGIQNIVVTYRAGVATTGVIPEHVRKAGRIILRSLWQPEQQANRPAFGSPDVEAVSTPSGLPIPRAALELLRRGSTEVGFA